MAPIEAYHVDEIHPAALVVAKIYSKVMSIIGLFLVMALICTVYKQLHGKLMTKLTFLVLAWIWRLASVR